MKRSLRRVVIPALLLLLSVVFGLVYDAAATAIEKIRYPRPAQFAAIVEEQAEAFGLPPAILWGMIRCESDFVSNTRSEDGAVGLLQITPTVMKTVYESVLREPTPDEGILYDPKTNLRVGAAWLSALYQRYGTWDAVYAAWHAGTEAADSWLSDESCLNEQGQLTKIPHQATATFVAEAKKSVAMYTKLYFES